LTTLESVLLGAVQGITEFLPISSSAHLIILPWFLRIDEGNINQLAFDVMLHFGTLFAILSIYGKRFALLVIDGLNDLRHRRIRENLLVKIAIATIPAAALGLLFKDFIEAHLRTPFVAVFGLVAVSIMMVLCERIYVAQRNFSYPVVILIGIAQALALVPGASRSGITITAGILLGLRKKDAVDFSFLLAIPIILGTSLYELKHLHFQAGELELHLYGMVSAFIFGVLSLKFLIGYLKKHSLEIFAYYRIAIAILILLFTKY
jgi:undecaprenyl-diphosphatase